MRKILISVFAVLFSVAGVFTAYLGWAGLFSEIRIKEEKTGPFFMAYNKNIGPYKNTGAVMDRIYNTLLGEKGVSAGRGFGLYYDRPGTVPDEKLRSIAGCIIEKSDEFKLAVPSEKFRTGIFPESEAVVTRFPYKGKISVIIGVLRVYPVLAGYIAEKKIRSGPVMEVYDIKNETISYIVADADKYKSVLEGFLAD